MVGDIGFGWRARRLLQKEKVPQVARLFAPAGVPQAIVAHLVESGGQDVLEEATQELVPGHGFLAMAVGRAVLVAVGDGLVVDGQDAIIGDGDTEDVAGEIIECRLLALAPWCDVNDPRDLPDVARQIDVRAELGEGIAEPGAGQGC